MSCETSDTLRHSTWIYVATGPTRRLPLVPDSISVTLSGASAWELALVDCAGYAAVDQATAASGSGTALSVTTNPLAHPGGNGCLRVPRQRGTVCDYRDYACCFRGFPRTLRSPGSFSPASPPPPGLRDCPDRGTRKRSLSPCSSAVSPHSPPYYSAGEDQRPALALL